MKLSLDEKTLIIIGIFAICLLFIYNVNEDDKSFNKNIIEEETRDLFKNTSSNNKNNNKEEKGKKNNNSEKEGGESQNKLEKTEEVVEKEERETAMNKFTKLNLDNENKVKGILLQSKNYNNQIIKLKDMNTEEKNKIQKGIITNLIEAKEDNPDTNFDSYLTYNGTLLRNSLLNTASTF
jgi:hypothetical protein